MPSPPRDMLDEFYAAVRATISVKEILVRYPKIVGFAHASGLTEDMRLARGRVKRLRDEVSPVIRLLESQIADCDSVQFPLDDGPIDCNIFNLGHVVRRIQITGAQRRERLNLMTELNKKPDGIGRGYLGVTDDQPKQEFLDAMARGRIMYSTSGAQKTLCDAISLCLANKSDPLGADTLLIDAPLNILPVRRVEEILPRLMSLSKGSLFKDVFLVGDGEFRQSFYKLK